MEYRIDTKCIHHRLYHIMAFLIGLSICENVSIIFTVGHTSFGFSIVINSLIFIYFFIIEQSRVWNALKQIPLTLKIYVIICLLSIIPGMIYFETISIIGRFFVGIIALILVIFSLINTMLLSKYKASIFFGITVGILLNVLMSIGAYITFRNNNVFSLDTIFPHPGIFYVPRYSFRAQGLFLEPSHFLRFFISVVVLVIEYQREKERKNHFFAFAVGILSILMLAYSGSGSVVIVISITIGYFAFSKKESKLSIITLILSIVSIGFIIWNLTSDAEISKYINNIVSGSNISDKSNLDRYEGMKTYYSFISQAPLGIGYNLTGSLREVNGITQASAFSEYIEMTLEMGAFGTLVYTLFFGNTVIRLLKRRNNYAVALAMSMIGILVLQIGTDYPPDPCIAVVIGLAIDYMTESAVPIETKWQKHLDYLEIGKKYIR